MKSVFQILFVATVVLFIMACTASKKINILAEQYKPDDKALYDSIVYLDSVLFEAYNTCKPDRFENYISENIKFYHDKGAYQLLKKN